MSAIEQGRKGKSPIQSNTPVTEQVKVQKTLYTLTREQYKALENKVGILPVREDTTPVQSGYFNGMEHVLRVIREGFVSE